MNTPLSLLPVLFMTALLVGPSSASVPDAGDTIHGCFKSASGKLRATDVDDGTPPGCDESEAALHWNVTGPTGQAGAHGEKGSSGVAGSPGAPGSLGASVARLLTGYSDSATKSLEVDCPSGTRVIGGGGESGTGSGANITQSAPLQTGEGWHVAARDGDPVSPAVWQLIGYAICVPLP